MQSDVKIIISAIDKGVKQTVEGINTAMHKSLGASRIFTDALTAGSRASNSLLGSLKGLIAGFAGLQGLRAITGIAREAEKAMFIMTSAVNEASMEFSDTGSLDHWNAVIRELSDELVVYSDTALKNAVSGTLDLTKHLGLSADQMKELIIRAADLSDGQGDLTQHVETLAKALTGSAKAARAFGVVLTDDYVKAWYEANKQTKRAWEDLTELEKVQVRFQVFLKQSAASLGSAADSANTFDGALKVVRKEIEKAVNENKSLKQAMTDLAKVIRENSGEIGNLIGKIVEVVAKIIEFAVKWKELIAAIGGTVIVLGIIVKLLNYVKALNGAFAFLTGMSIVSWIASVSSAMQALAASTTLAGTALKFFLPAAAAYAAVQIALLVKALWDWKIASDAVKIAQEDLARQKSFVDERAAPALKELSIQLGYVVKDLDHFNRLAKEGKIIYDQAAGAWVAAEQKKQAALKATTAALEEFGKKAKSAYDKAVSEAKKYAEQVVAFEEKIKAARMSTEDKIRELSRKGLTEEEQWADKKLQAEQKLAASKEALRQKDYEQAAKLAEQSQGLYADLATEVSKQNAAGEQVVTQTIAQTKQVAIAGVQEAGAVMQQIFGQQKDIASQMQTQWEQAAGKIKEVINLINQAKEAKIQISAEGLDAIKTEIEALVSEPKKVTVTADTEPAKTELIQLENGTWTEITVHADADTSKAQSALSALERQGEGMDITAKVTANTAAAERALASVRSELASIKDKTVTVTVIKKVKTVEENATGGLVKALARGGKLFGYGGGDKIRSLLEAGEFVIRKEAVRRYGSFLFDALNRMKIPKNNLAELLGRKAFAAGGPVNPSEAMTLTFNAGTASMPLTVMGSPHVTRQMVIEFETELRKMGLARS